MVVKTITITEDAYEALKMQKQADESFSEVIKRITGRKLKIRDIIGILNHTPEEHKKLQERMREIREKMGKDVEERIQRVRARYISSN